MKNGGFTTVASMVHALFVSAITARVVQEWL